MNAEALLPDPPEAPPPAACQPDWRRHTFTTDHIREMLAHGILHDDDPVEFLCGELHPVSPQSAPHANLFSRIYRLLSRRYPDAYWLTGQVPLVCGVESLPEPDLLVLRNDDCQTEDRHPRADEVVLVIEVARTSHQRDHWKAGLYAEGGIPEYWLIDLPARRVEVYQDPRPAEGRYAALRILAADAPLKLPELDQAIQVADLFPA